MFCLLIWYCNSFKEPQLIRNAAVHAELFIAVNNAPAQPFVYHTAECQHPVLKHHVRYAVCCATVGKWCLHLTLLALRRPAPATDPHSKPPFYKSTPSAACFQARMLLLGFWIGLNYLLSTPHTGPSALVHRVLPNTLTRTFITARYCRRADPVPHTVSIPCFAAQG